MHHEAKRTVTSDGSGVIDFIPSFLLMDTPEFSNGDFLRFLEIAEIAIKQGASFDMIYFQECRFYLSEWMSERFGSTKEEIEIYRTWSVRLNNIEIQNILNTHYNKEYSPRAYYYIGR